MSSSSVARYFASRVCVHSVPSSAREKRGPKEGLLGCWGGGEAEFIPKPVSMSAGWETSPESFVKAAFDGDRIFLASVMPFRKGPCKGGKLHSSNMQESQFMFPVLPVTTLGQRAKGSLLYLSSVRCGSTYTKFKCVRIFREEQHMCWYKPSGLCWRPLKKSCFTTEAGEFLNGQHMWWLNFQPLFLKRQKICVFLPLFCWCFLQIWQCSSSSERNYVFSVMR